jgi:hypothetical protein
MPAPLLLVGTLYIMNQAVTIGLAPVSMALVALAYCLVCVSVTEPGIEQEATERTEASVSVSSVTSCSIPLR